MTLLCGNVLLTPLTNNNLQLNGSGGDHPQTADDQYYAQRPPDSPTDLSLMSRIGQDTIPPAES